MKPRFKKIVVWLHRWLGLASGLVVVIVGITGCILAFEHEIKKYTQPYQFVKVEDKPFLMPSQLKTIASRYAFGDDTGLRNNKIGGVQYCGKKRAAIINYDKPNEGYSMIYINPYNGEVLKEKILQKDFFRIVLAIHFNLLLPKEIGQPIVAISILIFVILLATGLVLWWPKRWNKKNIQKSFTIKWGANFKRVNYDLHNVVGFYSVAFTLILALTGLVYGFEWFEKTVYWTTAGAKSLPKNKKPLSDTTLQINIIGPLEDKLWIAAQKEHDLSNARFQITFPLKKRDPFTTTYNPSQTTYYKREIQYYDQTNLQKLEGQGINTQKYSTATNADKLHRMNYDIHVGAIGGLAGKILAFFASLIATSLPITGFMIWLGKSRKKKLKNTKKENNSHIARIVA